MILRWLGITVAILAVALTVAVVAEMWSLGGQGDAPSVPMTVDAPR